jgi:hypothetical protein
MTWSMTSSTTARPSATSTWPWPRPPWIAVSSGSPAPSPTQADRALLVWQTDDRSVVEHFVRHDPYVANGLVRSWKIRQWNVVIGVDA